MLGLTLGCNAVTRAAVGKQAAGPSNPPPYLVRGEIRSLAEQEEQTSRIFEERRLALQLERQALEDSRERFLATLAAHPAMANRPIVRNEPGVRDLIGTVGTAGIVPIVANHHAASRGSATPPQNDRRSQVPAPARSAAMVVLIEGSVDNHLEDAEVQSFQRHNRSPPREDERVRSPLRAGIAERQDPGRCPDLEVGGRVGQGQIPYQREMPQAVAPFRHEGQVGAHCRLGPDPGVRPTMRQDALPLLGGVAPQVVITRDNFAAMIEDHLRQRGRPLGAALFSAGEPLTERARTALLPVAWITPLFIRFDGKGDPDLYLMEYRTLMAPNDSDDQLARVFKQSLKEQALQWYVRLPHESIDSFQYLSRKFVRQYSCNLVQPKRVESLFDIRMEAKESLKDFVSRFRSEAVQIEDAANSEAMVCTDFRNALLDGHQMKVDLLMKLRTRLQELYEHADRRIRVEADASRKRKPATVHAVETQPPKQRQPARIQEPVQRQPERKRPWGNPPRGDQGFRRPAIEPARQPPIDPQRILGQFVLGAEDILERIKTKGFFTYPPPIQLDPRHNDMRKNCQYYRSPGHLTRKCKGFAALLQDLIKQRLVDSLLCRNQEPGTSALKMKEIVLDEDAGDVNVIHGFCAIDAVAEGRLKRKMDMQQKVQESNKKQLLPQIVASLTRADVAFGDDDMEGVLQPHGDGLIVMLSLRVGAGYPAHNVKRILVDGGSAVDIMFMHCFEALAIPQANLRPSGTVLSGFSGERANVVGEVDVDIIAAPRTLHQRFIVVKASSPYNAILGRPWLHIMKAVPSTYHQCLKYPSSQEMIRIRGNQYAAMTSAVYAAKEGLCPESDGSYRSQAL